MARNLRVKYAKQPCFTIYRAAFRDKKLVYVALAHKMLRYTLGRSRIAYIGTTKKGAGRIASSAAWKGRQLLYQIHGIKYLEFHVVTCGKRQSVETWRKLERALLIRFREKYGELPRANKSGKKMRWKDERKYFTDKKLDAVIDGLSYLSSSMT